MSNVRANETYDIAIQPTIAASAPKNRKPQTACCAVDLNGEPLLHGGGNYRGLIFW